MGSNYVNIIIIDSLYLIRAGLKTILSNEKKINILDAGSNGLDALQLVEKYKPHILLTDINTPLIEELEVIKKIKLKFPETKVVILTEDKSKKRFDECINLKVDGYILKDSAPEEIISCLLDVSKGEKHIDKSLIINVIFNWKDKDRNRILDTLTQREINVLLALSKGLKNKEIAEKLFLSEKTVKNYITSVFRKLEVEDRVQATLYALNNNVENYYHIRFAEYH